MPTGATIAGRGAALKALRDAGVPVEKVVVIGSQVEIHCGSAGAGNLDQDEHDGPEPW